MVKFAIKISCRLWFSRLHSLRSLSLHNNLLTYLPREILSLVHLQELSLRGNPLVVRFVKEMIYDPPSLLELAGRTIKSRNIPYSPYDMPSNLVRYLDLASKCPNPKCAGMMMLLIFCIGIRKVFVFPNISLFHFLKSNNLIMVNTFSTTNLYFFNYHF